MEKLYVTNFSEFLFSDTVTVRLSSLYSVCNMSPGRGDGPYGSASASQVDQQMKTDVINMRTDIGELKDQMKLRSPESLVSTIGTVVSTAVAAAMADENAPAPVWAKSLTDSVATLTQKHETLNSAQKTLQATVAKLERELEALAAVGHPIWLAEESAKLHTAHIMRLSNFGKLTKPEIERFCKTHLDKVPAISTPTIEV